MVICVPSGITDVERRAVRDSAHHAGGGALLKNLDQLITDRTGLDVHITKDPLTAVVRGTVLVLDNLDSYRGVLS